MILYVRADGDISAIAARVREEVWKADGTVPQYEVRTLAEEVDAVVMRERLLAGVSTFFGLAPDDGATLTAAVAVLAAVALVAAAIPARRAATIDPMVALRSE